MCAIKYERERAYYTLSNLNVDGETITLDWAMAHDNSAGEHAKLACVPRWKSAPVSCELE